MGTSTRKMWKEIGWVQRTLIKVFELYINELPRHIAYNIILIHLPSIITGSALPILNTTSRGRQFARLIDIILSMTRWHSFRVFSPFPRHTQLLDRVSARS